MYEVVHRAWGQDLGARAQSHLLYNLAQSAQPYLPNPSVIPGHTGSYNNRLWNGFLYLQMQ